MQNKQVLKVKSVDIVNKTVTLEWVKDPDYISPTISEYGDGSGEDPHFPHPWVGVIGERYTIDREGRFTKEEV